MATEQISPTRLRKELFSVLDRVVRTGAPVRINRSGHVLKIVLEEPGSKLERIVPIKNLITGEADDLVEGVSDWTEERNL